MAIGYLMVQKIRSSIKTNFKNSKLEKKLQKFHEPHPVSMLVILNFNSVVSEEITMPEVLNSEYIFEKVYFF